MHAAPTLLPLTAGGRDRARGTSAGRRRPGRDRPPLSSWPCSWRASTPTPGREYVISQVLGLLGTTATETVHNHHNYAWSEEHHGERVHVVRKGATPAFPGQTGFIGGSMGDWAVVVEGVDSELSRRTLRSTVHGAGRVMSRSKAKGNRKGTRKGLITPPDDGRAAGPVPGRDRLAARGARRRRGRVPVRLPAAGRGRARARADRHHQVTHRLLPATSWAAAPSRSQSRCW